MKQTIRKSISLLLTLCMVLSLCTPALAAQAPVPEQAVAEERTTQMVEILPQEEELPDILPEEPEVLAVPQEAPEVPGVGRVDDKDPAVTYTNGSKGDKTWEWDEWNHITFALINTGDENPDIYPSVSLTFKGTGIQVYGQQAINGPLMSAEIDGEPAGNADFFDPSSTSIDERKVYEKSELEDTQHTLTLTFTRERSSNITHGKAGLQAAIDYFEILEPLAPQTVTVVGGTADKDTAMAGEKVTVTAAAPEAGMEFRSWTSSDGVVFDDPQALCTTFTMPSKPVTVKAGYRLIGSAEISPEGMTATAGSEELKEGAGVEGPVALLLDGDPATFWSTVWAGGIPVEDMWVTLDLGGVYRIDGLSALPRPSGSNGIIKGYKVLVSTDGTDFTEAASGTWAANNTKKQAEFAPVLATHVKLQATSTAGDTANKYATVAELRVTGTAVAPITQTKGAEGNVKLSFDAAQLPDTDYKYYYSTVKTSADSPVLGEERDAAVYASELTNGIELPRLKREYVNLVLVDGDDKVVTFRSVEVTLGEPQEYLVTVDAVGGTVTGGEQDNEWLPEGATATITAPVNGLATTTFHHWSSEDGVAFEDPESAETTFEMPAKAVTVKANYVYPAGTTFYLDAENGNDENTGLTAEQAWKTLGKMDNVLLQPGDKVLLKAGSVFEGQSLSLRGSGSAEAPVVVDMYDGATVGIAAGAKPIIHANGIAKADFSVGKESDTGINLRPNIAYGVHIKNVSHIQVNNLEVTNNSGTRQMAVGVVVEAASGNGVTRGIHLDGLYVHDVFGTLTEKTAPNGGIYMITTPGEVGTAHETRYDDISVKNCTVVNVSRTGISVGSSHSAYYWEGYKLSNGHESGIIPEDVKAKYGHTNVVISNNYVERAGGDAIVPQFCIAPLVEYNISNAASQNTPNGNEMYNAAIWPWRCEDALFQFNEAYGTLYNGDGQAYDCDSSRGTTYQYNYSHDNGGGFILLCQEQSVQSTVRYNISQNDLGRLFLLSNTEPAEIYNNTFYIGEGLSTRIMDGSTPSNLKNNIFYSEGTNKNPSWGSFTYENNLFYGFENAPTENGNITADPKFADPGRGKDGVAGNSANDTLTGYELMPGSPAIGAGVLIAGNGGRDYAGNSVSVTEKPNIGAIEGVSTQILVEKVELDQDHLDLISNGSPNTATLVATVTPEKATNKAVVWNSSDEAVATVDANGVITAKSAGTATITVTTENRNFTDTCTVTVTTINTSSPSASTKPKLKPPVTEGENTTVTVEIKPTVSGDKATANISTKTVTDAVNAVVKAAEQSGTSAHVEIAVKAPEDAKTVELSLPKAAVEAVATGKTECLIISSPVAEISLDGKALSAIAEAAGATVKIAVSKPEPKSIDTAEKEKIGSAPVYDFTITSGNTVISDLKGGAAVITVPHTLAEGQDGKFVAVWYMADGKLSHVDSTYDEGAVTFTVDHFSRYAIGYLPFADVAPGWYYESVVYAYNHAFFGGVGANAFAPQDSMTRAMLVTVLARLDGQDTAKGGTWDAVGVAWAKENDISDGTGLEQAVSREQLAVMLYRYAKAEKLDADLTDFSDAGSVSPWASEAMNWAVKSGIITGKSGALDPQGNASRAEVATMLQRFASLLVK